MEKRKTSSGMILSYSKRSESLLQTDPHGKATAASVPETRFVFI